MIEKEIDFSFGVEFGNFSTLKLLFFFNFLSMPCNLRSSKAHKVAFFKGRRSRAGVEPCRRDIDLARNLLSHPDNYFIKLSWPHMKDLSLIKSFHCS